MKPLFEMFPIKSGSVISAVDLIRGIGVYADLKLLWLKVQQVYSTLIEGKAEAALEALKEKDFVYLHI